MSLGLDSQSKGAADPDSASRALARGDFAAAARAFDAVPQGLTPAQRLEHAKALAMTGRLQEAEQMAMAHLREHGPNATAFTVAAICALITRRYSLALSHAAAAEQLDDSVQVTVYTYTALSRLGAIHEAKSALQRMYERERGTNFTTINDLSSLSMLLGQAETVERLLALSPPLNAQTGRPRYFIALPKSGGATVCSSIARILGLPFAGAGVDLERWAGFPAPWLHPGLLRLLEGRQVMFLTHAAPLPDNVDYLRAQGVPLNVHVRDPRDALVSLFEMGETYGALQLLRFERCRPGYALMDRAERLAALRRTVYPLYLAWIDGWLKLSDSQPGLVRFTTYESFCQAPEDMVARLATGYGAPDGSAATLNTMHFRKGVVGAHRDSFSEVESRAMYDAIPAAARDRFGWRP
ncbi:hypothetical protein ACFOGJ_00940 [Marinibaculum pumilum]|uniref:Sulfotransferase family protein n=1 Tax=Marinibaculum pumilum TaxID=1766165 RepID=A0ABV7KU13_9PROT